MSIGHNLPTDYYMTGVNGAKKIEQVPEERDLGIFITDEMEWSKPCNSAAAKAVCARHDQKNFQHSTKKCFSHCTLHTNTLDLTLSTVFRFGHRISRKILMYLRRSKDVQRNLFSVQRI